MNEDAIIKQIAEKARSVGMPPEEKARIRASLESYMEAHPVTDGGVARHRGRSLASPYARFRIILRKNTMPLALLLAIIVGGGTSAAASGALPGDILYPVKVEVNERVEKAFAFSDEADAKVEAKFAARRLEEAEKLSGKNRLDAETKAEIEIRFEKHEARVKARIEELSDKDLPAALAAHADFEGSLAAHEAVLAALSRRGNDDDAADMARKVRAALLIAAMNRPSLSATSTATTTFKMMPKEAAEGVIGAAENKIAAVERRVNAETNAEVKAEATTALDAAKADLAKAKTELAAGAYGNAFALAGSAHKKAQIAKAYLNAEKELRSGRDDDEDEDKDDDRRATSTSSSNDDDDEDDEDDEDDDEKKGTGTSRTRIKSEVRIELGL